MINSKTIQYPFSNADLLCLTEYSGIYPLYIGYAAPGSAVSAEKPHIHIGYHGPR